MEKPLNIDMPPCEVCRDPAIAIVASMFVPYSLAVCSPCLSAGVDTWANVVFTTASFGSFDELPEEARFIVENSLIRSGHTREELDASVAKCKEEWAKLMADEDTIEQ